MQSSSPYHECDTDCFSASQDFSLIPLLPWLAEDVTYQSPQWIRGYPVWGWFDCRQEVLR